VKNFYCLLIIFLSISARVLPEETFETVDVIQQESPLAKLALTEKEKEKIKEDEKIKDSYGYIKLGAIVLAPNIGVGYRERNLKTCNGNDLTLNCHIPLFWLGKKVDYFMPSVKYTYLKYRDSHIHSSYFGIGAELGLWMSIHGKTIRGIIPNIELVWGKERENLRFSQFGINIFPAVIGLAFTTYAIAEGRHAVEAVGVGALATSIISVSYTVGF